PAPYRQSEAGKPRGQARADGVRHVTGPAGEAMPIGDKVPGQNPRAGVEGVSLRDAARDLDALPAASLEANYIGRTLLPPDQHSGTVAGKPQRIGDLADSVQLVQRSRDRHVASRRHQAGIDDAHGHAHWATSSILSRRPIRSKKCPSLR